MTNEQMQALSVTYGSMTGKFDPETNCIAVEWQGERIVLAVDAVQDNPQLIADLGPEAGYLFGWLASHIVHQRTIVNCIAAGVLQVNGQNGFNPENISDSKH